MSPQPRADAPPGPGVLVAGGLGVLVVVAFVAAVLFGGSARAQPGDRVALVERDGQLVVAVARCEDERVTAVELKAPGPQGPRLWRIASAKGSIAQRYVVGAEPLPVGFTTIAPLQPLPLGDLEVLVEIDGELVDREVVAQPASQTADVLAPCGRSQRLGTVSVLFVVGALLVVVAYAGMVQRWLHGRRPR